MQHRFLNESKKLRILAEDNTSKLVKGKEGINFDDFSTISESKNQIELRVNKNCPDCQYFKLKTSPDLGYI